jgi:hypothetical protein
VFLAVEGIIISGMDGAATLLHHHLPHFAKDHPEPAGCKPGTINVRLDRPLRFKTPDFSIGSFSYLNGIEESYGFCHDWTRVAARFAATTRLDISPGQIASLEQLAPG